MYIYVNNPSMKVVKWCYMLPTYFTCWSSSHWFSQHYRSPICRSSVTDVTRHHIRESTACRTAQSQQTNSNAFSCPLTRQFPFSCLTCRMCNVGNPSVTWNVQHTAAAAAAAVAFVSCCVVCRTRNLAHLNALSFVLGHDARPGRYSAVHVSKPDTVIRAPERALCHGQTQSTGAVSRSQSRRRSANVRKRSVCAAVYSSRRHRVRHHGTNSQLTEQWSVF